MIQAFDGAFFKHLFEEHLAQGGGQLVDQPGDAQVVIADDGLFGVKHLAHFQGDLCLFKGFGQVLHPDDSGADAHYNPGVELAAQGVHDGAGQFFQVLALDARLGLFDQYDVVFADVEDKILLLVREEILNHIKGRDVVGRHDADEQHHPGDVGVEVQLPRLDIDVTGQDVVQNHVFDEVVAVVLLIIILLDAGKRNCQDVAEFHGHLIRAFYKHRILRLGLGAEGLVGEPVPHKGVVVVV